MTFDLFDLVDVKLNPRTLDDTFDSFKSKLTNLLRQYIPLFRLDIYPKQLKVSDSVLPLKTSAVQSAL